MQPLGFILACLLIVPLSGNTQTEKWDSLMNLAKTCHNQKEYSRSNEYYQQVIDFVNPIDDDGRLFQGRPSAPPSCCRRR